MKSKIPQREIYDSDKEREKNKRDNQSGSRALTKC